MVSEVHPLLISKGKKPRKGFIRKCKRCDKDMYVQPCFKYKKYYCSYACLNWADPDKKKELTCVNCNEKFEAYKSYLAIRRRTFCSNRCGGEYKTRLANMKKDKLPTVEVAKKRQRLKKKPGNAMRTADNAFSLYIRARDGSCQRCGKTEKLQCSHIKSRSYRSVRCDEDNAIALCVGCHLFWWHRESVEAARWFDEKWPGRYDRITAKILAHKGKIDWDMLKDEYRQKLKELN